VNTGRHLLAARISGFDPEPTKTGQANKNPEIERLAFAIGPALGIIHIYEAPPGIKKPAFS
jgi:hypothetical protein